MQKSALYKGCLEPIILQLLKDNGRMYGYQITQKARELTRGHLDITEGALYPLLHRLEEAGILETEIESAGNRMRKYYSLTKAGKKQSVQSFQELQSFIDHLSLIFQPKTA
ncbi:PadR family transcriptional regulator [Sediminibacterium goheungense]|uniref:PadR family transcriptional regulator n=1 Tax=Sediminibacterium goheungense TaxID=1086393 RepID=A0A4R6IWW2_9BACT|nr:helix-turn-helix transcriptional regulator [Sediminibacterium goheungense]TDO27220.1 PadR family transcriptional regulator [Sediminibacterium goheungense]